jgi:hypothetical protein
VSDIIQQIPVRIKELRPYDTPEERLEEVCDEIYGSHALPKNIYFIHDPKWNTRFWAIQNINDQWNGKSIGFWTIIGMIFMYADARFVSRFF